MGLLGSTSDLVVAMVGCTVWLDSMTGVHGSGLPAWSEWTETGESSLLMEVVPSRPPPSIYWLPPLPASQVWPQVSAWLPPLEAHFGLCLMEAELIFHLSLHGSIVFYNLNWASRNMAWGWRKGSYSTHRVHRGHHLEQRLQGECAPI